MTHTTIRTNFNQALDAQLNFAAQITLDFISFADKLADCSNISLREVLDPDVRIDLRVRQDFLRASGPDTIQIGQANFNPFITGQIYTFNSRHSSTIPVAVYALDFRR